MTKINKIDIYKKIRKTWEINPKSRIVNNKRKTRQQLKKEIKNEQDY